MPKSKCNKIVSLSKTKKMESPCLLRWCPALELLSFFMQRLGGSHHHLSALQQLPLTRQRPSTPCVFHESVVKDVIKVVYCQFFWKGIMQFSSWLQTCKQMDTDSQKSKCKGNCHALKFANSVCPPLWWPMTCTWGKTIPHTPPFLSWALRSLIYGSRKSGKRSSGKTWKKPAGKGHVKQVGKKEEDRLAILG